MINLLFVCLLVVQAQSVAALSQKPVKVGIVLSGGAALGLAHIGVLKVFEQEGIPISALSGNSMGSVVGGLYAAGFSARQLDSIARAIDWARLFDDRLPYGAMSLEEREAENQYLVTIPRRGLIPDLPSGVLQLQNIEILLKRLLAPVEYNTGYDFDSLPMPYRAVAVDIETGEKKVFRSGSLSQAIRASIAIPIIFTPARIDNRLYFDGGLVEDLPVEPIKDLSPDFIIAVDLSKRSIKTPSLIDIIIRTSTIASEKDRKTQRALADIVIYPALQNFFHSDFIKAPELIRRGEEAAESALPEIRRLLDNRTLATAPNPVRPRPRPFVRSVTIAGLRSTRAGMIRREIKTKPGTLLDFSELVSDLERVYHTGLFSHVDYALTFPTRDSVDIEFFCSERNFGTYALGGCFDNTYGVQIGSEIAYANVFGSGLKVGAGGTILNPLRGWAGLSGTRLFLLPFNYRLQGYYKETEHRYYENGVWVWNYIDRIADGEFKAGLNIETSGYFKFGINTRAVSYHFLTNDPPPAQDSVDRLITPAVEFKYDAFKNLLFPTEGTRLFARIDYGSRKAGSDHDFTKFEFATKNGFRFIGPVYIESSLGAGFCLGKPPLVERFRTGNPDFSGYEVDEFLTEQRLTAGLTCRVCLFNLLGMKNYPVYLELAGDAGSFLPYRDLSSWQTVKDSLVAGASIGLRTNTPVGPLFFKFGLNRQLHRTVYISVGNNPARF